MAKGFLPNQTNGVVKTLMTRPYLGCFPPKTSTKNVIKVKESPLTADVSKTKLIDHIFLLSGISECFCWVYFLPDYDG